MKNYVCASNGTSDLPSKEELFTLIKAIAKNIEASEAEGSSTVDNPLETNVDPETLDVVNTDSTTSDDNQFADDPANEARLKSWVEMFEYDMLTDSCAADSIVCYYLDAVGCNCAYVLCPLGHEAYEQSGKALAEFDLVREAAKKSGLFAAGIPAFVSFALSNADCWVSTAEGVAYLLATPELCCYIPYRNLYLAERLGRIYSLNEEDRSKWYDIYKCIEGTLRDEMRGY